MEKKTRKSHVLNFKDVMLKSSCTPAHTFMFYRLDPPSVDTHTITRRKNELLSDVRWVQSSMSLFQFFTVLFDVSATPLCLEKDVFATTLKQYNNQPSLKGVQKQNIIKKKNKHKTFMWRNITSSLLLFFKPRSTITLHVYL